MEVDSKKSQDDLKKSQDELKKSQDELKKSQDELKKSQDELKKLYEQTTEVLYEQEKKSKPIKIVNGLGYQGESCRYSRFHFT